MFEKPVNEYWALICLRHGLEFLYSQAVRCDQVAKEGCDQLAKDSLRRAESVEFVGLGNVPGLNQVPKTLLTCAFHWYAVTACNYVKVVGAIAYGQDDSRPLPAQYVERVIPEVLAFRDKVAAHFAWATRNSKDNEAERLASILPPLSFVGESFQVGTFSVALRNQGKESDSKSIAPWSIRTVHEGLRARYWPELTAGGDAAEKGAAVDGVINPN